MSRSQFAVYQLKKKPELRNLLFRTYEELAQDQIPVQVKNYEQVYLGTMKPGETPEQIKKELEKKQSEKERKLQEAMLDIRKRFGKNAVLKGMNLEEGATARERNSQIGGHKA